MVVCSKSSYVGMLKPHVLPGHFDILAGLLERELDGGCALLSSLEADHFIKEQLTFSHLGETIKVSPPK